ncbi:hypothetical protein NFI96_022862 [Prochilodus magdalenae]|nr:hypothetical protein NFI96_022862 [Prochilodus magdalenae]
MPQDKLDHSDKGVSGQVGQPLTADRPVLALCLPHPVPLLPLSGMTLSEVHHRSRQKGVDNSPVLTPSTAAEESQCSESYREHKRVFSDSERLEPWAGGKARSPYLRAGSQAVWGLKYLTREISARESNTSSAFFLQCHPDTMSAQDPPPYIIPVDSKGEDVKVYKVHTPFNPGASTIQDQQTRSHSASVQASADSAKNKYVSYDTELGRTPGMTTCTTCREQVLTNVTYKVGAFAWLMCILFILCGLVIGCCLIPFFVKHFKDAYHLCPKCKRILYVEKKRCC